MSEKELTKISYSKSCSAWVNKFAQSILEEDYNIKTIRDLTYSYIEMNNEYKNKPVEFVVIKMLSSNNKMIKFFKDNNLTLDESIDYYFKNNNSVSDFTKNLKNFIEQTIEPIQKQNISNLKKFKNDNIDKIYSTGVLDFNFVKNKFDKKMDFWKVKEAVSWMVGFIENCEYELKDIVGLNPNGTLNKNETFSNILKEINKASLTQKNPFVFGKDQIFFNDAKGGEVDVLLWDNKNKKIISMSATRDRGFKIEGNQFPRHLLKSLIIHDKITEFYNKKAFPLSCENIQKLIRSNVFNNTKIEFEKAEKIAENEHVIAEINNLNSFAKDITLVRDKVLKMTKTNFHKNGLIINDNEMSSILAYSDAKVSFVFYGEVLENKQKPLIQGGLTCLAYRDNFKRLGNFRITDSAANIFMRNITKRFNGISQYENNIEKHGKDFLIHLIESNKNNDDIEKEMKYFSDTNVFNDERSCLFKSLTVLMKNIYNETNKVNYLIDKKIYKNINDELINKGIKKGLKFFFGNDINDEKLDLLTSFFKDNKQLNKFIKNISKVKTSISEVPQELDDLENQVDKFKIIKDNIYLKLKIFELTNKEKKEEIIQKKTIKRKKHINNKLK